MSDAEDRKGSPARSRSASRSKSRSSDRSRSRSRTKSGSARRSRSKTGGSYGRRPYRSRSRSPMSRRRRHMGDREDPEPNRCLGVFGLSLYTQERDVKDVFSRYGPLENVQVVYDHQTGRSRGFAFVYFEELDDAIEAKERCNGIDVDGRRIRVDYSVTERAHTPTPGIYLGKPTSRSVGYGRRRSPSPRRRRSPSPYGRRRYSRSRSRSRTFSPKRY